MRPDWHRSAGSANRCRPNESPHLNFVELERRFGLIYGCAVTPGNPADMKCDGVECVACGHDVLIPPSAPVARATASADDASARSGPSVPVPGVRCAGESGGVGEVGGSP